MQQEFNAISLFSGLGGDSLGIENAGGNVIAYNEYDKTAIESHQLNFPHSILIQDESLNDRDGVNILKIPDSKFEEYRNNVDLVFAGFPCFIKGTPVLTKNGYKSIEEVTLEDELITHTGKIQKIVNLQKKNFSGKLYNISVKYHPEDIICTNEHPFYVRTKKRIWNNQERRYETFFEKPIWKNAEDLNSNDYVGMVLNKNHIIPQFSFERKVNQSKKSIERVTLDNENMWFTLGYFLGDGWIEDTKKKDGRDTNKIRFAINNIDQEMIVSKISKILPITDKKCDTPGGKCKKFGCADFKWFRIFQQFGKYAHGKKIPEWVQDAPEEFIQEFLHGYFIADGCKDVKRDSVSYTTVSKDIAYGIQRLYLKLGLVFSITKTIRPETCVIQGRTVNQRDTYLIRGWNKLKRKSLSYIDDSHAWFSIKSSFEMVSNKPVFNFEVNEDNTYIVSNTIVHNCQSFSSAGKRKVEDPRNTMFREFSRVVNIIKPKYLIGENVKGLLTKKAENGELYFDIIKAEFERIGYRIYDQVCKANLFRVPQKRERLIIVGIRNDLDQEFTFPVIESNEEPNLIGIIQFNMEGAIKIEPEDYDMTQIPSECILTNMDNDETENNVHPYLQLKAKTDQRTRHTYNGKTYDSLLSFGKRDSPIHVEIIDIRKPSKTIICAYDHQPRLFVPLRNRNGYYIRPILPDELKQIQGFPADFRVAGSRQNKIKQIGNAVPPPLIEEIVTRIRQL